MTDTVQQEFIERASRPDHAPDGGPAWLVEERRTALSRFRELGLPSKRVEEWKHTSLAALTAAEFSPAEPRTLSSDELPELAALDLGGPLLLFVDGRFAAELSQVENLPAGLHLGSIAEMLTQDPGRLESRLAGRAGAESAVFRALNAAHLSDGAWVSVDDGAEIAAPLQLVYVTTAASEPTVSHPRTLISTGRQSHVTVVESFLSLGEGTYFTNSVGDVLVGDGAAVDHYRVQLESEAAFHVAVTETRQGRDSRYRAHNLHLGGKLVRHDLRSVIDGEGAECTLNGLHQVRGAQHMDSHTELDHAQPHCSSRELYKVILSDRARSVFRGRIIVREGAQKTDAVQSNPNLLLSSGALAHSLPQLEIYADDVKCTHGATIGRLDEETVFYLRSRGLTEAGARQLLIEAFVGEVLDGIHVQPLREALARRIAARLPFGGE